MGGNRTLPTSRNNSSTSTSGGGNESSYIPLPLAGMSEQDEKILDGSGSLNTDEESGGKTLLGRVCEFAKRDLRIKFGLIFLGLWILNWICKFFLNPRLTSDADLNLL